MIGSAIRPESVREFLTCTNGIFGTSRVTHALLPAFVLVRRLDVAEAVGGVVEEVGAGVPRTSSTSCDQAIFVDQAADASLSSYAVLLKIDWFW
jgi:hypothetical protein